LRIGDLVRIGDSDHQGRHSGVILKFDRYTTKIFGGSAEPIAGVLWSNGTVGWILEERLVVLTHECKSYMPMV